MNKAQKERQEIFQECEKRVQEMRSQDFSAQERQDIIDRFGKHISLNQTKILRAGRLDTIERRRCGTKFFDGTSGREMYDAFASAGCFNAGRCNPEIIAELADAVVEHDLGSFNLLSKSKIDFAQKLVSLCPGDLNRVVFSGGGGEAIESALKLAWGATGRKNVIAMDLAYHGHSGFSLSAGGKDYYKHLFQPLLPGFTHVPFNDLESVQKAASKQTAAIILEPVQGEGGIHVATDEFLEGLRKICDAHGIMLIFDEIQTGFGRTGKLWFCEHSGVIPDIMVLAKSISGGLYPNAAIIYRDTGLLLNYVDKNPEFHSSCGGGSDIGCRISQKTLEYLIENDVPANAAKQGKRLKAGFVELMQEYPKLIKEIRGIGLMLAIEYRYDFLGSMMSDALNREGMFAAFSGNAPQVMRFMLSPVLTDEETEEVLAIVHRALKRLAAQADTVISFSKIPFLGKLLDNEKLMVKLGNWARTD